MILQLPHDVYNDTLSYLPFDNLCSLLFVSKELHQVALPVYQELLESVRDEWYKNHLFAQAAAAGQYKMIQYLVSLGACYYNEGIIAAVRSNNEKMALYLLPQTCGNIRVMLKCTKIATQNCNESLMTKFPHYFEWNTILYAAAGCNNRELVDLAIRKNAWHLDQAIAAASGSGHRGMIDHLISRGGSITVFASIKAASKGRLEFIDETHIESQGILPYAVGSNNRNIVDHILRHNAFIPRDVLLIAARKGHLSMIEYMVTKYNVQIDSQVLIQAAANNHRDIVDYILSKTHMDRDIIVVCIRRAAMNNHKEMVDYLLMNTPMYAHEYKLTCFYVSSNGHVGMEAYLRRRMLHR